MHDDMTEITLLDDVLYMHIRLCVKYWIWYLDLNMKDIYLLKNVEKSVL